MVVTSAVSMAATAVTRNNFAMLLSYPPRLLTSRAVTTPTTDLIRWPLTRLAEDERLLRDSVYESADREIRPLAREMDEHAKIPVTLLQQLFDLGVMGIEIP